MQLIIIIILFFLEKKESTRLAGKSRTSLKNVSWRWFIEPLFYKRHQFLIDDSNVTKKQRKNYSKKKKETGFTCSNITGTVENTAIFSSKVYQS